MNKNPSRYVTTTGTIEEVVIRAGFDEAVLFVHSRFPTEARGMVITLPADQALNDDLMPGQEVIINLHACGLVTYEQPVDRRLAANG